MKKQLIGLIIVFLLVLSVVISFILYNQWPLLTGDKIILATMPVDPFDPFRGQYMNIRYEISSINDVEEFEKGDKIYVLLKEDDLSVWRFNGVSRNKPSKGDFIRGKVIRVSGNTVGVEYGVEQFFFERHAEVPTTNITVEVKVASSGRAKLAQLLQNGESIEIKYEKFNIKG